MGVWLRVPGPGQVRGERPVTIARARYEQLRPLIYKFAKFGVIGVAGRPGVRSFVQQGVSTSTPPPDPYENSHNAPGFHGSRAGHSTAR